MKTKLEVRICPFCGHHGHELLHTTVDVRYEDGEHDVNDIWQMECKCCGARGPTEYDPRLAAESWNFICQKPAHEDDPMMEEFSFNQTKKGNKQHVKKEDNEGQQGQLGRD